MRAENGSFASLLRLTYLSTGNLPFVSKDAPAQPRTCLIHHEFYCGTAESKLSGPTAEYPHGNIHAPETASNLPFLGIFGSLPLGLFLLLASLPTPLFLILFLPL